MTVNAVDYPALDEALFAYADKWIFHDGLGQPVDDTVYVRVMYSNGCIANKVRVACAWVTWTGGRNWWIKPDDDRLWVMCYAVI
jgi:hypothetical protein